MHGILNPHWWTAGITAFVQFVLFLRWLYRRIRNDEITRAFVHDMAVNHETVPTLSIGELQEKLVEFAESLGLDPDRERVAMLAAFKIAPQVLELIRLETEKCVTHPQGPEAPPPNRFRTPHP